MCVGGEGKLIIRRLWGITTFADARNEKDLFCVRGFTLEVTPFRVSIWQLGLDLNLQRHLNSLSYCRNRQCDTGDPYCLKGQKQSLK